MNTTHQKMVARLFKHGSEIYLSDSDISVIHAILGISGEAGELLDSVKKSTIYNQPYDRENIVEELGDLEFYMEALRLELDITREETLQANMQKLAKRYENFTYSDEQAKQRKDKQ